MSQTALPQVWTTLNLRGYPETFILIKYLLTRQILQLPCHIQRLIRMDTKTCWKGVHLNLRGNTQNSSNVPGIWEAFLLREVGSQPSTVRILCHRIQSRCYQREEPIKHALLIRGSREGSMRLSTTRPGCHPSALAQEAAVLTRDEKRRWGVPESHSSLQRHTPSDLSSPAKPSAPPVAPRWELSPWP